MKNTIKKDMERLSVYREFINENTLLECVLDDDEKISFVVRYVDTHTKSIKEHCLARVSIDAYHEYYANFVQINDESDTIALFAPSSDGLQLDRVYDAKEHHFASQEFQDLVYQKKFKQDSHNRQFLKQKK